MNHNCQAIVIRKNKTGEQDLNITLLTDLFGKIPIKARGASKINSKRLGSLQLGNIIKVNLHVRENHFWVNQVETIFSFLNQPKNLTQTNLLFYFLEIINKLLPESQPNLAIYKNVANTIKAIEVKKVGIIISSEIHLLENLGYGVPVAVRESLIRGDFKNGQKQLQTFVESIIEKRIESYKLFS